MAMYHDLINKFYEKLMSMEVGEKVPAERILCEKYKVSRTTIRSAMAELESRGYLKRLQGSGTYVSRPNKNKQNLSNYYSFTEQTKKIGKVPKTLVMSFEVENASEEIASKLNLKPNDKVIKFERVRIADYEVMMYETTYIPHYYFEDFTKSLINEYPLYDIFEQKYHLKIHKVNEVFSATRLNARDASRLSLTKNTAALVINRTTYDSNDVVIEYSISLANSDKFVYETTYFPN